MRFVSAVLPLIALSAGLSAAAPASAATPIAGRWLTEGGKAVVLVAPCGKALCGRIERVLKAPPGATGTDANNPDPALRGRPIVGTSILSGFADAGKDWRGRIYNPEDGKSYKSIVARAPDGTLKVKGCIAFFCQTQTWTPAR